MNNPIPKTCSAKILKNNSLEDCPNEPLPGRTLCESCLSIQNPRELLVNPFGRYEDCLTEEQKIELRNALNSEDFLKLYREIALVDILTNQSLVQMNSTGLSQATCDNLIKLLRTRAALVESEREYDQKYSTAIPPNLFMKFLGDLAIILRVYVKDDSALDDIGRELNRCVHRMLENK